MYTHPTGDPDVAPEPCPCPKEDRPVCSDNGHEYPNPCVAECAKVQYSEGPCEDPIMTITGGLGGVGGAVLEGEAEADEQQTEDIQLGCGDRAVPVVILLSLLHSVLTYDVLLNITLPGRFPLVECACTMEYAPVCDAHTNTTYANSCLAACAKAPQTGPGICGGDACECLAVA